MNLKNVTLLAATASCVMQVGAQLFAVSIVASTIAAAPPRSFLILQGEFGYDSSSFWNMAPTITFLLLIIALITNWKTPRRKLILSALILFIFAGILAALFLDPLFADMMKVGYSDRVDEALQAQARRWYMLDWMVWVLGFVSGLILLLALTMPVKPHVSGSRVQA